MKHRIFKSARARKRVLIGLLAAALVAGISLGVPWRTATAASAAPAARAQVPAEANGLGQLSGILPASHLTLPSAIEVNLSQEYVRLPIYPGIAYAGHSRMPRRSGTSWRMPPPPVPRTTWA